MNVKKILKWSVISIVVLILLGVSFGAWFMSLIPKQDQTISQIASGDLPYLSEDSIHYRGKILAIVTSTQTMGNTERSTGYELTELSRAYYVFQANGFEVDVASPLGGEPPMVIDKEDMGVYDHAFLNDQVAQQKIKNTLPLSDVSPEIYVGVYFVGGKGAMYDFPENKYLQHLVQNYHESDKVIGAVCHGPAALINVQLKNGRPLLENKRVTSFTNKEELLLIREAETIFPFLLQEKIEAKGGQFSDGSLFLENVVHDKNLITGQNPWSTWKVAETMIQQLGYKPKQRKKTSEELAVEVLKMYERAGYIQAKILASELSSNEKEEVNRMLIAKHGIVAGMQWKIGKALSLVRLTSYLKRIAQKRVRNKG